MTLDRVLKSSAAIKEWKANREAEWAKEEDRLMIQLGKDIREAIAEGVSQAEMQRQLKLLNRDSWLRRRDYGLEFVERVEKVSNSNAKWRRLEITSDPRFPDVWDYHYETDPEITPDGYESNVIRQENGTFATVRNAYRNRDFSKAANAEMEADARVWAKEEGKA